MTDKPICKWYDEEAKKRLRKFMENWQQKVREWLDEDRKTNQ